jgi:predicted metal-dependent hydrolase
MNDLDINYRRSSRAKYLRITVHPTEVVTITVPGGVTLKHAKEFAQSKQAWVHKQLEKIRQRENLQKEQPELSSEQLLETQNALFARLERFSNTYNLPYRQAAFRCQKTRWGSCSRQNNISLNINIALLPEHLQDYILLHELCHIRHKNHSKAFWSQLDGYCDGRAKELAKELKSHGMRIRR